MAEQICRKQNTRDRGREREREEMKNTVKKQCTTYGGEILIMIIEKWSKHFNSNNYHNNNYYHLC